jgi:hypothetical protein
MQAQRQHHGSEAQKPVTVFVDNKTAVSQPGTFRVCPLGVQFYSPKKLPDLDMIEFDIKVPGKNGVTESITCTGVVVHCRQERGSDLYRIWVKFLDVPESKKKRIQCVARSSEYLCPYCENF